MDIEKAHVSYNHGYDNVEQLQLSGTANIRENKKSQVTDALINLKELDLSVEKFEGYGAYDFFPSENNSEKSLS